MLSALPIPPLDAIALVFFLVVAAGYRFALQMTGLRQRSIMGAMLPHRIAWMLNMAKRDNRLMDAVLLTNLSQGNAFFASTAAIAIGGLVTVLGYGDSARSLLANIPLAAETPAFLWEAKVIFLMSIFVYAFFKFAWAFRLTHYMATMIGATPLPEAHNAAECEEFAHRAGQLTAIMADHSASGLASFYYAIAALAWFFHPALFMLATTWVVAILIRRDFFSHSLQAIKGELPDLPSQSTGPGRP